MPVPPALIWMLGAVGAAALLKKFVLDAKKAEVEAAREKELEAIVDAALLARRMGLEVHGGHGLNYDNVLPIAKIPEMVELNIGHSIIARAVFVGIEQAVREMKELLNRARGS